MVSYALFSQPVSLWRSSCLSLLSARIIYVHSMPGCNVHFWYFTKGFTYFGVASLPLTLKRTESPLMFSTLLHLAGFSPAANIGLQNFDQE